MISFHPPTPLTFHVACAPRDVGSLWWWIWVIKIIGCAVTAEELMASDCWAYSLTTTTEWGAVEGRGKALISTSALSVTDLHLLGSSKFSPSLTRLSLWNLTRSQPEVVWLQTSLLTRSLNESDTGLNRMGRIRRDVNKAEKQKWLYQFSGTYEVKFCTVRNFPRARWIVFN